MEGRPVVKKVVLPGTGSIVSNAVAYEIAVKGVMSGWSASDVRSFALSHFNAWSHTMRATDDVYRCSAMGLPGWGQHMLRCGCVQDDMVPSFKCGAVDCPIMLCGRCSRKSQKRGVLCNKHATYCAECQKVVLVESPPAPLRVVCDGCRPQN